MTPEEKNENELKLVQLKARFIAIGVVKMPTDTILSFMPKNLNQKESVKWSNVASNVWNGRSTRYKEFMPAFEKAYEYLKHNEKVA